MATQNEALNTVINQLDEDECTPLGYVLNDDLLYELILFVLCKIYE